MGAWGTGVFDNDDALDWVSELETEGLQAAGGAVQTVLEGAPNYLEAPECAAALAAAEVIAALRGRPAADLPPEVRTWISRHSDAAPGEDLTQNARRAVALVMEGSELAELWAESDEVSQWRAAVADLQARLT